MSRAQLQELVLPADAAAWARAGLNVQGDLSRVGATTLRFGAEGWSMALEGVAVGDVDGLAVHEAGEPVAEATHPLGVTAIDHVVIFSDDADRTSRALDDAGLDLRRMEDVPGDRPLRRGFVLSADCLFEVVTAQGVEAVRFWGLTLVVDDLDAAVAALGELCGSPRDAVQPGRRIATVRKEAGLGFPVALISPRAK